MKKAIIPLMTVLLLCASCDRVREYFHKMRQKAVEETVVGDTKKGDKEDQQEKQQQLQFTRVSYCSPDSSVIAEADIPKRDGSVVADSILNYLHNCFPHLREHRSGNRPQQGFERVGQQMYETMRGEIDEFKAGFGDDEIPEYALEWSQETRVTMVCNQPRYVTMLAVTSEYRGGAHGMHYVFGTTFDKQTGRSIDQSILTNTDSPEFKSMLQQKLLKYFTDNDGDENASLDEYLLVSPEHVPIGNVSLTANGVVIMYQPYEIAPYAAGLPEVVLTFEQVRPFLTQQGLALINM